MSIVSNGKKGCRAHGIAVGAIILAVVLVGREPGGLAQEVVYPMEPVTRALPIAVCPQPARLPNVPVREPRPAEGAAPDHKWQTAAPPDRLPTAAFVEPLHGNDAVIEVIVGQGRLVTLKADVAGERGAGVIAVSDPTVIDFDVMPNPRIVRLIARRAGVTDLSIMTAEGEIHNFEVRVVYDLAVLTAQLRQLFPDAQIRLTQIREHLAVEGQARSIRQVDQILKTLEVYLASVQVPSSTTGTESAGAGQVPDAGRGRRRPTPVTPEGQQIPVQPGAEGVPSTLPADTTAPRLAVPESGGDLNVQGTFVTAQVINMLRVPGVQQVMLQVQIAELNRTSLRNVGADWIFGFGQGNVLETLIGGPVPDANLLNTVRGVFPSEDLAFWLRILRTNSLVTVLAEPNLVALSGQQAEFLAGGEIPIPVATTSGGETQISVEWREYGVKLQFVPYVLEDEGIRLTVVPEESTLDYANAIEVAGSLIPAMVTRRVSTTVEMRQGQTLAMAGLLRVSVDANTRRIPGLGDLPYIGPLFSNTSHQRQEKELLILVTPYLVAPMNPEDVPCLPGEDINDPNDLEFYLLNRIEGRTGRKFYPTRNWDDPWHLRQLLHLEQRCVSGPVGLSPPE